MVSTPVSKPVSRVSSVSRVSTVLLLLCPLSLAQVNFGGSNSNSKPASPRPGNNGFSFGNNNNSGRPASSRPSTGAGNNGFSFGGNNINNNNNISGNNNNNNRPSFGSGSGDGVSIEFGGGGGGDLSSNVKTLTSLLGSRAPPTPDPLTRCGDNIYTISIINQGLFIQDYNEIYSSKCKKIKLV